MGPELGPGRSEHERPYPHPDADQGNGGRAGPFPGLRGISRSQRQTYTFTALFAVVLLIGLVAAGNYVRWWTIGGSAQASAAVLCPTQATAAPAQIQVDVYNGTGRTGLAARVAGQLRSRSFEVGRIGNADRTGSLPVAVELQYGPAGKAAAHTVALEFTGKVRLSDDGRDDASVDLVIGEKYRALRNAKQAAAAIALKPAPAGCVEPDGATTAR